MSSLELIDVRVSLGEKEIVKGVSLKCTPSWAQRLRQEHPLQGDRRPSRLHDHGGDVLLDGESILEMEPDERSRKGLFLAFQYPMEIPGVSNRQFPPRRAPGPPGRRRGDRSHRILRAALRRDGQAGNPRKFTARSVNEGFSGGEKKRCEILQMAMLKPKYAILDETDSGLDIDALKVVSAGVNAAARTGHRLSRHHPLSAPARLHRAGRRARHVAGRIVRTGGKDLALELEAKGYDWVKDELNEPALA
jgi:Fe-S cluster assembly ATP-binding protein